MDKAAVVILNWNGLKWFEKFIGNVVMYSAPYPVYVIDNASDDDSIDYLKLYFPEIKIIQLLENFGFADGYNKGLKAVEAETYILLNSDVEVTPNWIDPILNLLTKRPEVAAVQPKLLDYNNRSHFEYAGAAGGMLDKFGVPFCRGRIFDSIEKDTGQYTSEVPIFWASGAAFFIRSKVFWEVKGFDPDFFAHMEEIDLCWRLHNNGYEVYYCPDSTVYHVGGGTLNKINNKKYYLNFRNSLWMLLKNLPRHKVIPIIFGRLLLDGAASIKMALDGKPIMLWIVLKAHVVFYLTFLKTILKRSSMSSKVLPSALFDRSIVKSYYIDRKKSFKDLEYK